MNLGVLALQGDVPEHEAAVRRVVGNQQEVALVRGPADLAKVDALLLPGGESTTIADLLHHARLWGPLGSRLREGMPVLATCAGLILLASHLEPSPGSVRDPTTFGILDVRVRRNDYGRQAESFEEMVDVEGLAEPFPGVFIRAPRILALGPGVSPLAHRGKEVVGVRSGPIWGLAFHPELSGDPRLHEAWLRVAEQALAKGPARPGQGSRTSSTPPVPTDAG